jgi:hypothetical protein
LLDEFFFENQDYVLVLNETSHEVSYPQRRLATQGCQCPQVTTTTTSTAADTSQTGIIVGSVIGAFAALMACCCCGFIYCQRRGRRKAKPSTSSIPQHQEYEGKNESEEGTQVAEGATTREVEI